VRVRGRVRVRVGVRLGDTGSPCVRVRRFPILDVAPSELILQVDGVQERGKGDAPGESEVHDAQGDLGSQVDVWG